VLLRSTQGGGLGCFRGARLSLWVLNRALTRSLGGVLLGLIERIGLLRLLLLLGWLRLR